MVDKVERNKPLIILFLAILSLGLGIYVIVKINSFGSEAIVIEEKDSSENSETKTAKIRVDIQGEVKKPGVYEFDAGVIFDDALTAAGGLTKDADKKYIDEHLNRAEELGDQQKVYIPAKGEEETIIDNVVVQSEEASGKVNINTATVEELDSLSGIGPSYAQKIIDGRPYKSIEEIMNVKGIGESTFEKIKDSISV